MLSGTIHGVQKGGGQLRNAMSDELWHAGYYRPSSAGYASTDPTLSLEPLSLLKASEHGDSASHDREPVSTLYG